MSAIPPQRTRRNVIPPTFAAPRTLPNNISGQMPLNPSPQTPFQEQPFGPDGAGWSPQVPTPSFPAVGGPQVIGGGAPPAGPALSPTIGTFHGPTNQFGGVASQSGPLFDAVRRMLGRGGSWNGQQPQGQAGTNIGQGDPNSPYSMRANPSQQQPKMTIQGGSMSDIMQAIQGGNAQDLAMRYPAGESPFGDYFNTARNQQGQSPTELMQELLDKLSDRRTERTTRARANRDSTRTSDRPARRTSTTNRNPGSNRRRMNDLW